MTSRGERGNADMGEQILEIDKDHHGGNRTQEQCRNQLPSTKTMAFRTLLESSCLIGLMVPMAYIYIFMKGNVAPFTRGFFCDDQNLKHPMLPEKISVGQCVAIWAAIGFLVIICTESIFYRVHVFPSWWLEMFERRYKRSWIGPLPLTIIQIYRIVGHFGFGAVATLLTTEIAKYQVGRLRPYFLTVCNMDLTDELCKDGDFYKFVTEYTCNGTDPSTGEETHDVMEARKSFLSGHSSFSFYTAAFLILYLQARLYTTRPVMGVHRIQRGLVAKVLFRGGRIARPFIQFSLFGLAFWICLTRISDYKHHPGDVAIGILVGIVWAILLHAYTLELFTKPLSFWSTSRMNEHALSRGKLPEMVGAKSSNVDQPDSANRSRSRTIL